MEINKNRTQKKKKPTEEQHKPNFMEFNNIDKAQSD